MHIAGRSDLDQFVIAQANHSVIVRMRVLFQLPPVSARSSIGPQRVLLPFFVGFCSQYNPVMQVSK